MADKQHKIFLKLPPERGTIYDRMHRVLVMYLDMPSIYAVPREIDNAKNTAKILAEELKIDRKDLEKKLARGNYFAWVKRNVDAREEGKIKKLSIKGVYFTKEGKRFYPGSRLACHILGITDVDANGLEGVELYYDAALRGEYGFRRSYRDAKRREIVSFQTEAMPARDGADIVLTIDEVIQHIIEKEIGNIVKAFRPKAVSVIAMNPLTGEILGLANYPSFDPNDISHVNSDYLRNRAISDSFEPGSVFKIVTASAALEEEVVDFNSKFFCENGSYKIGKRILHDYKPHGTLTFREIIEKSSNIGVAKVAGKLGKNRLCDYIKRFNFGNVTNIDLPGEAPGIVRGVSKLSYVDMTTIPMGQGIAVTPLQLVSAFSAIANDGVMMKPYVVKSFLNKEGIPVNEIKPEVVNRVVSKETAGKVKELLFGVVEHGTGRQAMIDNFRICGKTGTAQKVDPKGGYYENRYISSFAGFAPSSDPKVSLVVIVDEPKGKYLASQVAAPAFKNIMENVLSYLEIEGDKNELKKTF